MNKKNILLIINIFIYMIFLSINSFAAPTYKINNIETETNKDGKTYIKGTTIGQTDNMKLLVKIYTEDNQFEYFNMISIKDNSFEFNYSPTKAGKVKNGDTLTLKISGDIEYESTFYYSSEYERPEDENTDKVIELLKDYTIYYDTNSDLKLKFEIEFNQDSEMGSIYLNGLNFTSSDTYWKMKDEEQWNTFLSTILNKVKELINKDVWIYICDSNGTEIETYPDIQPEQTKDYITQDELEELLSEYQLFKSNKIDYNIVYTLLNEGKTKYIKIKAKLDYSKNDDEWKNLNKDKLETFAEKIATAIKKKYKAEIDIIFYDKDDNLLKTYGFDFYKENANDETDEILNEFIPWNKNKATGLVLMLRVSDYGDNSAKLDINSKEGMDSDLYSYEMELNTENVEKQIENLRNDNQKIVFVSEETDSNNILLTINNEIVELLKDNKCLFIFDCNNYKIEMDFTDFKKSGEITIQTMDVIMDENADDYAKPIGLKITIDEKEATEFFEDGIKCLLHYDSEKTRYIKDLRSINIFNSQSEMFNTTASTKEKGFIFKYKDTNIYYAKSNQYVFNDITSDDIKYKNYAELVVSKNIIPGINNGTFNPLAQLTRGDFIYYISRKMGAVSDKNNLINLDSSYPYFRELNGVYELGLLPSHFKTDISPNTPITIEEIIYITVRCYEINDENNQDIQTASLLYLDKDNISTWAIPKVSKAVKLGMIPSDGELLPKDIATKLDAAEIIYGLLVSEEIF